MCVSVCVCVCVCVPFSSLFKIHTKSALLTVWHSLQFSTNRTHLILREFQMILKQPLRQHRWLRFRHCLLFALIILMALFQDASESDVQN